MISAEPILLIQPFWGADVTKVLHCRMESLSLAYLAASLRLAGMSADIIDAQLLCLDQVETVRRARQKQYDVIGVSISAQRTYAISVKLIRALRAAGVRSHIVVGGIFATFAHDRILLEVPEIDSVVRGDGDNIIAPLVDAVRSHGPPRGVLGVTFRDPVTSEVIRNPDATPIGDLDTLPFAARDDLPRIVHEVRAGERMVGMLAGRGCEAKCSFCSIPAFALDQGRRFRTPTNVIKEMTQLYDNWGVRHFRFYDDTLIGRGRKYDRWLEEFSDLLASQLPNAQYEAMGVRADGVTEEMFTRLHRSGLRRVFVGLDAGSASRLRNYHKPQTIGSGERTVQILRRLDIDANFGFIMFQPTTTIAEVRDSYQFLERVEIYKPHNLQNRYNLFYGVLVDERVTREGLIDDADTLDSRRHWRFADPAVALMAKLTEEIADNLNGAHVLSANLELLLIELRVASYPEVDRPQRPLGPSDLESLQEESGALAKSLKAIWSREFGDALARVEAGALSNEAVSYTCESSARSLASLGPIVRSILSSIGHLETKLPGNTRLADVRILCQNLIDMTPPPASAPTRAESNWSTLTETYLGSGVRS